MPPGKTLAANEQALASDIMSMLNYGLEANIPAEEDVVRDSLYCATNTKILWQEHNGTWTEIARGETVIRLAQLAEKAFASLTGRATKSQMEWAATKFLQGAGVGADPTEVDIPSPLTVAETQVFNAAGVVGWTDLNLSGTVGAQATLVLLKVIAVGTGNTTAFRKNGDTDEFYRATTSQGMALADVPTVAHVVLMVATDANGIVERYSESTNVITVDIIAYIK